MEAWQISDEMVERLKGNWTAWGGLDEEMREAFITVAVECGSVSQDGMLNGIGHCLLCSGMPANGSIYRLRSDWQRPAPPDALVKGGWYWVEYIGRSFAGKYLGKEGGLDSFRDLDDFPLRVPLNTRLTRIPDRPEVEGYTFAWGKPQVGDTYRSYRHAVMLVCESSTKVSRHHHNGYRWIATKAEQEEKPMQEGLKHKYNLTKADGRPVDPEGRYFILKLNSKDEAHAKASCRALQTYAGYIQRENPVLAKDLRGWIERIESEYNLELAKKDLAEQEQPAEDAETCGHSWQSDDMPKPCDKHECCLSAGHEGLHKCSCGEEHGQFAPTMEKQEQSPCSGCEYERHVRNEYPCCCCWRALADYYIQRGE